MTELNTTPVKAIAVRSRGALNLVTFLMVVGPGLIVLVVSRF